MPPPCWPGRGAGAPRDHWLVRETMGCCAARWPPGRVLAHPVRVDRAGLLLRRHAARTGARRRPQLHAGAARRRGARAEDHAVGRQLRRLPDGQRPDPPACAASTTRPSRCAPRGTRSASRSTPTPRSRSAWSPQPRRHRLDRRDPHRDRRARRDVARCADRPGSQPALQRPREHGHPHLRPPHRLAELDLPAPQRRRREGRAQGLRQGRQGRFDWNRV